jgi:ATP-binding cassette subfamily B protein
LDYKTDANLRMALNRNYDDVTTIMVASRISPIMNCTQIIVLDEGKVIGQGTHEELMANCTVYREIADTQMGGM